jgi:hypothetical protein
MMIVVVAITVLGACADVPPATVMDREIYSVAVAALSRSDTAILTVIRKETLAIPRITRLAGFGGVDSFGFESLSYEEWKDVPIALRRRLTLVQSIEEPPFTDALFRSQLRLVPTADIDRALSTAAHEEWKGWARFEQQFGAGCWTAFSKALITRDLRDSIVFYENSAISSTKEPIGGFSVCRVPSPGFLRGASVSGCRRTFSNR